MVIVQHEMGMPASCDTMPKIIASVHIMWLPLQCMVVIPVNICTCQLPLQIFTCALPPPNIMLQLGISIY